MKKMNTKGFGVVEVILVVIIVGLLGGVGYFVYQRSQDNKNSDSSTVAESKADEPTTQPAEEESKYESYTSDTYNYTFEYPKTWSLNETNTEKVSVKSPDASVENPGGETFIYKGGQITVQVTIGDYSNYIDDVLTNKAGIFKDARSITVDGVKAVRALKNYPGSDEIVYVVKDNYLYTIKYESPSSPQYSTYLPDYNHLVETFRFN